MLRLIQNQCKQIKSPLKKKSNMFCARPAKPSPGYTRLKLNTMIMNCISVADAALDSNWGNAKNAIPIIGYLCGKTSKSMQEKVLKDINAKPASGLSVNSIQNQAYNSFE